MTWDTSFQDAKAAEARRIYADELPETLRCDCGYPPESFACRIRHIHLNTGDAKASRD